MTGLGGAVGLSDVVLAVGAGGVGKTTTAAALGVAAASSGRRVCVVTVDPARRLADARGVTALGSEPRRIEQFDSPEEGEFWAMMLDPKATFDDVVRLHCGSREQADEILANPFYQRLSTSLPGVHEYMAIETLHRLALDDRFDLVVVDTPPSQHVLDLVDAPDRLTRFLDNRMYRTLVRPVGGVARLAAAPARALSRRVAAVVGGQIVDDAIGFFEAFQGMEEGFVERARAVRELLSASSTLVVAIATPKQDTVSTALEIIGALGQRGISTGGAIANMTTFDAWPDVAPFERELEATPELALRLDGLRDRHVRAESETAVLAPLFDIVPHGARLRRRATELGEAHALATLGRAILDGADRYDRSDSER